MNKWRAFLFPCLLSGLFFACYAIMSLKLYSAHQTRGDLTAYVQGMWNTTRGHFMASTYNYSVHNFYDKQFREITVENSNILGIHFNPILLLFVPLYAAFPLPQTMLIIQAFLVAAGGLLMYLLAKQILKHEVLAYTIEVSYLLYTATVSAVLSQFHAYTLALFFGPLLLLASRAKRPLYYYVSLACFLLVQENTSLVATVFGLYLTLGASTRRRGVITSCLSIVYFILTIQYAIPGLSPYHFYLFSGIYGSPLGGNIPQIIAGALHHPSLLIQSIATEANKAYLGRLALGIFPFALGSPAMLLVASTALAQNILSSSLGLKTGQMHYESGSVPFLFYAVILGISLVLKKAKHAKINAATLVCFLVLAIMTAVSYKQWTSHRLNPTLLKTTLYSSRDKEMDSLVQLIPANASVSTQDYLSAHLAGREGLYQFPIYYDRVDYLLLAKDDGVWPLTVGDQQAYLADLRKNPGHTLVGETTNFILFKRIGEPSSDEQFPHPSQLHN